MPKGAIKRTSEHRMLADAVTISRQFQRSVRLDSDLGRDDALLGYICQGTARSLLENMARQIVETKQRAFTWTGPYGGGKSSLALMLCSLVGGNPKLRAKAKQILGFSEDNIVHRAFESRGSGWLVIPVYGKRAEASQELSSALAKAKGIKPAKKKHPDVVAELVDAAQLHPQGVIVVIDELGKLLEASALDDGDIGFFQELAERASRCSGKLVIVGILHQAFDAYASRLGRQARDEWAKVQGRFVDIPLVSAADEVIELVGRAITVSDAPNLSEASHIANKIATVVKARRPATPPTFASSLLACWPLHPVTASLLGPISRRKFGQNERSTFGFLASREPLGFVEFLNGFQADWNSMYGPSDYWDYLKANLEPAILASPDGHRWAQSAETVERTESRGTPNHARLTKAIALIEMFRNGSGLVADEQVLSVSTPGVPEAQIRKMLEELADWKVVIERKHLGAWGIYSGSDFDIEGAINTARGEIGEPDLEGISTLSDLQPILAKRLYHQTGTMRWFTRRIIRLDDVEQVVESFQLKGASAGCFIMCLPPMGQSVRSAEHRVRHASIGASADSLLLGTPKNAERILELGLELAAAERVMRTRPELHGDSVARRELIGRIESVRSALEEELADAFSLSRWYQIGAVVEGKVGALLSALASNIAERTFRDTPHIFSELINREDLSSNSVKARKDLMYRMASHGHLERLGYEGFPADAGLYQTILHEPGLHRPREKGTWSFGEPNFSPRGRTFDAWWIASRAMILDRGKVTSLPELYKQWASAPIGLRKGVMPVLSLAFFLAHRSSIALYVSGVFTPDLTETVVDEWVLDSSRISFQHVEASENQVRLADALAETISGLTGTEVRTAPLDIARGLVGLIVSLPGWTKRSAAISQRSQLVRAMLLKASDPHKVLFADLPVLLDAQHPDTLNQRLIEVTNELTGAYGRMLGEVRAHLLRALDHVGRHSAELHLRAATVKGMTGDFRLDAFATRLESYKETEDTVEGLISLAVNKPAAQWVDRDIDAAMAILAGWAVDFRKAETMAPLRGRPSSRRVIGVVFGASHGQDATGYVDVDESDTPAVDRLVKSFLAEAQGERKEIILAALAEAGAMMVNLSGVGEANG